MKNLIIGAMALLMGTAKHGQFFIDIYGNGNTARGSQSSSFPGNLSIIYQGGDYNDSNIDQTGSSNYGKNVSIGNFNHNDLEQVGDFNFNDGYQLGNYNDADVIQSGDFNISNFDQIGNRNLAYLDQNGNNNISDIDQIGNRNRSIKFQSGDANFSRVYQDENANISVTTQFGDNNSSDIHQDGNRNYGVVNEIGDDISTKKARASFADLIKSMSDNNTNSTIILVGIGDSIENLISNHQSLERCLKQVKMPKMKTDENR